MVNVSTRKDVAAEATPDAPPMPQFPPGSPFEEFFKEFFDRDKQQQEQQPRRSFSLGSGFVIDAAGFVVTNNHVIADADEITVIFSDDIEYPAKLIGTDTKTDLALLKIERPEPFPFVDWADSDQVRVGDWMIAIGNPFGLGSTVTAGIISARGRDIRAGPYDDFFQVDAAINRGNSGGPSFTLDGKVFGVNTAIFSPSGGNVGIGFAIPSNLAKPVIDSLMKSGKVARGWLGRAHPERDRRDRREPGPAGVATARWSPASRPAARRRSARSRPATSSSSSTARPSTGCARCRGWWPRPPIGKDAHGQAVAQGPADGPARRRWASCPRTSRSPSWASRRRPPTPPANAKIEALGITVASAGAGAAHAVQPGRGRQGRRDHRVDRGSTAAEESLKPGDLIVEVGQEEVSSPPEVTAKVNQAQQEGKKSILLLIDRQGDLRFVALRFKD